MPQVQLGSTGEGADASRSPLLSVKDLTVTFRKRLGAVRRREKIVNAVDNVTFDINQSEIVAIVGESGCGKTTLAKCIMRSIRPNSGSITFNGIKISDSKKDLHSYYQSVQMIYQDPFESLVPRQDVHGTLAMPLIKLLGMRNKDEITAKVQVLLEEVGLDPVAVIHRYPHQLSGGQRQRINIARALAPGPKLLIADEPVTMLDAAQKLNIIRLLSQLQEKRNLTIVLITHDLASARLLSRRTMVMYLGKIMESGETQMLLSKPRHPYVELILNATPSLRATQSYDNRSSKWIEESEKVVGGCVFEPRCRYSSSICKQNEPRLNETGNQHYLACHNPLDTNTN